MVRTQLIPEVTRIQLDIPQEYVGQKVEVLIFGENEGSADKLQPQPGSVAHLRGSLKMSDERYDQFRAHLKNVRAEWDREF